MADGLPPLKVTFLADTDDLQRGMSLTSAQMEKLFGIFRKGEEESKKLSTEISNIGTQFEKFAAGISSKAKQITAAFLSFGSGGALTGVLKNVGELDKKMYGLSKTAAMTGQSFGAMSRGIDDLNAKTKLSITESTEFFKVVSEGTKGVRMTATQVSKLGQTLSQEFGPSIDDVTQAFQKLAQIQEKDVFLFRKIDDNMNAEKLGAYAARLVVLNKVSEDQLNTLFRTVYARTLGEKAQSVEQKRMMEYTKTVQDFNKIFQDITLNIGKELMPMFKELVPYVKSVAEKIAGLLKDHPGIVKLVGSMVLLGPAIGTIGRVAGGLGGLASIAKTALGKDGSSPTKALYVQDISKGFGGGGGGGGPGGVPGWGSRIGKGLGFASAGLAVGYAGEAAGEAVGGQGGAGIKAASRTGEYALYGAGIGSVIPGLGTGVGALIGGLAGLVMSFDDLEEALTGNKTRAAETAKAMDEINKKRKAEAEVLRSKRLIEAEKEAGIGMDDTRFGTMLATSRAVQQRLRAGGMSEEDVKTETKAAAGGQASSAWLREQRKLGIAEIQAQIDVARKEIESLIPDDDPQKAEKVAEQVELVSEKFGFIKAQARIISLRNLMLEADQINESLGMITSSLKDQTALELEFYGNAEKAQANIGQTIESERMAVRLLTQKRDQTLEMIDSYGGMEAAQARALELQSKTGELLPKEKQELDDITGSLAAVQMQNKMIVSHNREILTLERSRSEVYDQRLAVQQSELSLMESQAAMVKEMYLGAGPTLEFQMQQVQQLERMKATVAANLKNAQADLKLQPERVDLQQKVNALQQKQVDLTQKQLSLTKNLREGYLDSMTAMTNAEGTFAKFVLRKDMGMGEMQRTFLAAGGLRTGMVGAGATGPTMRWKPGGGPGALQFMSPEALQQLGSQYGEEYGPQQIFANVANAISQTPLGQFGAQAPESGAASMGGRRGPAITVQNPQQQATEVQKAAAAQQSSPGSFESQIVSKMEQIIGIMSGTRPVPADTKTKDAVAEGVQKGQSAVEDKKEQQQRQEATKQAQDMRRGTLEKGGSAAEAIQKQSEKLDESERREQAKFELYNKTFSDWDSVAGKVNTSFIGIGKQGGAGATGTQYAQKDRRKRGMTTAGYAFEEAATGEQIGAVSRGLPIPAAGGAPGAVGVPGAPTAGWTGITYDQKRIESSAKEAGIYMDGEKLATKSAREIEAMIDQYKVEGDDEKRAKISAEIARARGAGEGIGRMSDAENEFAQWKQAEELKKLNANVKEGNQITQEVGKEQVDASKEVGQNIKSSLEQQKMDVSPVVTAVDSGVMQAKASGGWIARMAGGGRLPGFGGGDRVLAMLEPGEFVVNKNAAKAFPALLDSINKNRYANGGTVGMLPSPAMARAGGTIMPRFNISVRGDTAKTLVDSVGGQLSKLLNDMFTPQGTSGRLYDLGS